MNIFGKKYLFGYYFARVVKVCQVKEFSATKAKNMLKSGTKCPFLVKRIQKAAFFWHETKRILLILLSLKTISKFFGNWSNLCQFWKTAVA